MWHCDPAVSIHRWRVSTIFQIWLGVKFTHVWPSLHLGARYVHTVTVALLCVCESLLFCSLDRLRRGAAADAPLLLLLLLPLTPTPSRGWFGCSEPQPPTNLNWFVCCCWFLCCVVRLGAFVRSISTRKSREQKQLAHSSHPHRSRCCVAFLWLVV